MPTDIKDNVLKRNISICIPPLKIKIQTSFYIQNNIYRYYWYNGTYNKGIIKEGYEKEYNIMITLTKIIAILKVILITILLIPGSIPAIIIGLSLWIDRDSMLRPHSV